MRGVPKCDATWRAGFLWFWGEVDTCIAAIRGGLKFFFSLLADSAKIALNDGFAIRGRPKYLVSRGGYRCLRYCILEMIRHREGKVFQLYQKFVFGHRGLLKITPGSGPRWAA
jgi:hypothetical protein